MADYSLQKAHFHLPGLFEFYDFYRFFLPIYRDHPEFFYGWCDIGSLYGAPADSLWGGGRLGGGTAKADEVFDLARRYGISARLTFSNSLLRPEHLTDESCNALCARLNRMHSPSGGIIVHSDLLAAYIRQRYPALYLVSSTTKVLSQPPDFIRELDRPEFRYVVADFRLNKAFDLLQSLPATQKQKVEFLCNECCAFDCPARKACYESVSRICLGEKVPPHRCSSPDAGQGYLFSKAMENPGFIGMEDIRDTYLPMGFRHFKIEGRNLGSALLLEFILYYMVKPAYQLRVRELTYLDSMLDLF